MQNNTKPLRMLLIGLPLAMLSMLALPAHGAVSEILPGDDVRAAIAALQPGDELVLAGGVYGFDSRFNITVVGPA